MRIMKVNKILELHKIIIMKIMNVIEIKHKKLKL